MTKTNGSAKILLVSNNPSIVESTREVVGNAEFLNLIEDKVSSRILSKALVNTQPDVVLLDFDNLQQPFFLVYKLASEYPMFPSIAILPESKIENADRVVQAGANAYISFPYASPDELMSLMTDYVHLSGPKAIEQTPTMPSFTPSDHPANTFTVFSPKGGAGCTTIATNLAIGLHKTLKEDVLLIDGKHLFGHVALYLNLLTGNSITDLITHAGMLDQQLINQVVVRHKSGIHVLPSPNSVEGAESIEPADLFSVLQGIQDVFPNIVIDAGNHLDENTVTYMDASNKILLVLNPDLASMRDAKQFIEISSNLSYPKDKIMFVLNLMGRKEDIKREEIESILKMQIFGRIPADEDTALSSVNDGVPIIIKKPRHAISKAIFELVNELDFFIQTGKSESQEVENEPSVDEYLLPTQ